MINEADPLGAAVRVLRLVMDRQEQGETMEADAVYLQTLAERMGQDPDLRASAYHVLSFLESALAFAQGKGYGTATIKQEVSCVLHQWQQVAPPGSRPQLAVDIGGNVGEYTAELASRFPDLEIHVFEPAASNVARLRQRFGALPRVTVNPVAVADANSTATLFADEPGSGMGSLSKRRLEHRGLDFSHHESVQTIRFEDYWSQALGGRAIDILKLDIEGHELDALAGMGQALAATRVIQFEFGGCNIDTRTFFQDFWYFFSAAGFVLNRITPLGLDAVTQYREVDEFFSTTNFVATNTRFLG